MKNRAMMYGDGLFETIKISNKKALFLKDHYARLSKGFLVLDYESISYESFSEIIQRHIEQKSNRNLRIRITFFRLGAGLYTPQSRKVDWIIESTPLDFPYYELNPKGLKIGIAKNVQINIDILSNLKTISALTQVVAGLEKKANKWDDCLVLNYKQNIVESIAANLFLFYENTLYTPALTEGCVAGILRKQIIKIAKTNQIKIIEKVITINDLEMAETIFLTNAIQGVQWVENIVGIKKSYHSTMAAFFIEKLCYSAID